MIFSMDLSSEKRHAAYLLARGFKDLEQKELSLVKRGKAYKSPDACVRPFSGNILTGFKWQEINYQICINAPLLSRDPVAAMLDERFPGAVMIRKNDS